ncbi:MAGUK p55 subfamily member 7, partial [Tachysurus ichikawai]
TSRVKRNQESDGVEYHFISKHLFETDIHNNKVSLHPDIQSTRHSSTQQTPHGSKLAQRPPRLNELHRKQTFCGMLGYRKCHINSKEPLLITQQNGLGTARSRSDDAAHGSRPRPPSEPALADDQ